jgi:hypothetical protein
VGKYNSSLTRVTPIFDELLRRDSTGLSWLPTLVSLPSLPGGQPAAAPPTLGRLEDRAWAPKEKSLPAPTALLEWLVRNAMQPASPQSLGRAGTRTSREALVRRDPETIAKAIDGLRATGRRDRAWYVLEGPSCPDVYLRTAEAVIVIEGKRTEAGPTTSTSWMQTRH